MVPSKQQMAHLQQVMVNRWVKGVKQCKRSFTSATAVIFTEKNDINDNQYLVRINKLLEDGWVVSRMNTQTVDVDPKLENYLHKETLVSFVILEKPDKK